MNLLRRIHWRWVTVGVLIGVAFALGYVGFQKHLAAAGRNKTGWDIAYLSVQLFVLESGPVDGPVELELQIARFLAPAVAFYTVVLATLALFVMQIQRAWLWTRAGHVVVCGLGRKGARLVEELRQRGEPVVVIENDPRNDDLPHCRALGAVILQGAANDEWTLRTSYLHRANTLISVIGEDGANVETAVLAHQINRRRSPMREPLKCVVHVGEPRLRNLFEAHRIYGDPDDPFELELFNVFEVAARAMLREPPVLLPLHDGHRWPPHLLAVGLGRLGEALVRRALKDWRIDHPALDERLQVTVVDAHAARREEQFRLRYPGLAETCRLRFVPMDVHSADFARGAFLSDSKSKPQVSAAYVCLDNDSSSLSAALTLRRLYRDEAVSVVARMSEETGLATLLGTSDQTECAIPGIRPVGLLDLTCNLDVVLGGPTETLAQAIHQAYLYDRLAEGQQFGSRPSLVTWDRLDGDLKESNRQQARHVPTKLSLVGCETVPSTEDEVSLIEFSAEEVELLARDEHQRWVEERTAGGWTFGPEKDHVRKISPYLVPWEELSEDVKDYDRQFIRRLPANLAKADYKIRRTA